MRGECLLLRIARHLRPLPLALLRLHVRDGDVSERRTHRSGVNSRCAVVLHLSYPNVLTKVSAEARNPASKLPLPG